MKRFVCALSVATSCLVFLEVSSAQWPLGKETAQMLKQGEQGSSVTITGRFQVFVSPNIKGHSFMLDTDTGRLWIFKKDNTSGEFSLHKIPVEDLEAGPFSPSAGKKVVPDTRK
jgi:hypothetical protein